MVDTMSSRFIVIFVIPVSIAHIAIGVQERHHSFLVDLFGRAKTLCE